MFISIRYFLSGEGKPVADILLIQRVDIVPFSNIDRYHYSSIGQCQRVRLGFPQHRPVTFGRLALRPHEIGKLNNQEGKISFLPIAPPIPDQRRKKFPIFNRPLGVGFALVPGNPFDTIINEGRDHGIV